MWSSIVWEHEQISFCNLLCGVHYFNYGGSMVTILVTDRNNQTELPLSRCRKTEYRYLMEFGFADKSPCSLLMGTHSKCNNGFPDLCAIVTGKFKMWSLIPNCCSRNFNCYLKKKDWLWHTYTSQKIHKRTNVNWQTKNYYTDRSTDVKAKIHITEIKIKSD